MLGDGIYAMVKYTRKKKTGQRSYIFNLRSVNENKLEK